MAAVVSNNPHYIQVYFTNDDNRHFIQLYYPHILDVYDALKPGAFKCDLWRLLVVYTYGGVYNDAGHVYCKKLDDIIDVDNDHFVLAAEWNDTVHNAFFAGVSKAAAMAAAMIERLVNNVRNRDYGEDRFDITGPRMCSKAMNLFLGRHAKERIEHGRYSIGPWHMHVLEWRLNGDSANMAVYDAAGNKIIACKFKDYYKIMYDDRKQTHYKQMYEDKDVFQ